jgi:hypothetical protein
MSSLRISHGSRGVAAPNAGGEAHREPSGTGVSFAVTLGAAALAAKGPAATPLGGETSGNPSRPGNKQTAPAASLVSPQDEPSASDGLLFPDGLSLSNRVPPSHARAGGQGSADDAAPSLALQGAIATPQEDMSSADRPSSSNSLSPVRKRIADQEKPEDGAAAPQGLLLAASPSPPAVTVNSKPTTPLANAVDVGAGAVTAGAAMDPSFSASLSPSTATVPAKRDIVIGSDATTVVSQPNIALARLVNGDAPTVGQSVSSPAVTLPDKPASGVGGVSPHQPLSDNPGNNTNAIATTAPDLAIAQKPGDTPAVVQAPALLNALAAEQNPSAVAVTTIPDAGGTTAISQPALAGASSGGETQPRPVMRAEPFLAQLSAPAGPGVGNGTGGDRAFDTGERSRSASNAVTPDAASSGVAAISIGGSSDTASIGSSTVASASAADAGAAGAISDQVASHLVRLVSSGSRDMVVRLRPPELGDLTVRVAVSGRDVSTWFTSPQPQVQSAIGDAIGQLQATLADAGYNLSGAWVGADASGARQQGESLPALPPTRSAVAANEVDRPALAVPRSTASGLNVYV